MKHSKSGLFLMEMIVCIFFFSLSAAVSAQMFAKSHVISNTAIYENHAVIEVNNLAESFYSEHGDFSAISEKFYGGKAAYSEHVLDVYFDEEFRLTNVSESETSPAHFLANIVLKNDSREGMKEGTITFYEMAPEGVKEIYSLDISVDVPNTPSTYVPLLDD